MLDPLGDFSYTWPFYAAAVAGYLLGSIPFGLVLTRLAGLGDIRKMGSGNIGATNVLRTGNKPLAALTLLLDGGKGAAAVLIGSRFGPDIAILAGGGALLGHLFPVWLTFSTRQQAAIGMSVLVLLAVATVLLVAGKGMTNVIGLLVLAVCGLIAWGGKGVATTLGILLAIAWPVGLLAGATWLAVAAASRYASVAGLAAVAVSPIAAYWLADFQRTEFAAFLAVLVVLRHHANIRRLIRREEPKLGRGKTSASQ